MANDPMQRPETAGFLPEEYVERRTEAKFYVIVFLLFVVVMVGVAGAFMVTQQRWSDVRTSQRQINAVFEEEQVKLEQLRALEGQRSEMLEKARVTSALLEPIPRSVLMAELVGRLPGDVTLFTVKLEAERVREAPKAPTAGGGKAKPRVGTLTKGAPPPDKPVIEVPKFIYLLTVDGVSGENKLVADYLASLQESPLLKGVELVLIETKVIDGTGYRGFEITAELRGDADAREVDQAEEVERETLAAAAGAEG